MARASGGEVRSLTYVIADNYPTVPVTEVRSFALETGKVISGLIKSTRRRRADGNE